MSDRLCYVGKKAKRLPRGAALTDRLLPPRDVSDDVPDTTGPEATRRLARRSGADAELIGYSSDNPVRLVAMSIPMEALHDTR